MLLLSVRLVSRPRELDCRIGRKLLVELTRPPACLQHVGILSRKGWVILTIQMARLKTLLTDVNLWYTIINTFIT